MLRYLPFLLISFLMTCFFGCKKNDLQSNTVSHLKIEGGGKPFGLIKESTGFGNSPVTLQKARVSIRRNPSNATALNQPLEIIIKDDTAAVRTCNPAYTILPDSLYTVNDIANTVKTGGSGGFWKITMNPGEFARELNITVLNPQRLIPGKLYALAFSITAVNGNGVIDSASTIVTQIAGLNAWDGVYRDDFCNYHPLLNTGYTCGSTEIHLVTRGINSVYMYWPPANNFADPVIWNGNLTYLSLFYPIFNIDPATNKVLDVWNDFPSCGGCGLFDLAQGWPNNYDPASRTFNLKYGYQYTVPGVFDTNCREWTQQLVYLGPR